MLGTALRLSPLQDELEALRPTWGELGGMPVPLDFGDPAGELAAAATLGLCDASALARLTIKGAGGAAFLSSQGVEPPSEVFQVRPLGQTGIVARTGSGELFLEDEFRGTLVSRLSNMLNSVDSACFRAVREDASILLCGSRAVEVFLQTCGYDFRQPGDSLVMTRVAGVSCSILHRQINGFGTFQIWVDGTFGAYLWETLLHIGGEMGGRPVGLSCFFPQLVGAV